MKRAIPPPGRADARPVLRVRPRRTPPAARRAPERGTAPYYRPVRRKAETTMAAEQGTAQQRATDTARGRRYDTPMASYRVQLHTGFTFDDARALVPYLAELGISHLYCSPLFAATPGSTHGYDVTDHGQVNPELGGL